MGLNPRHPQVLTCSTVGYRDIKGTEICIKYAINTLKVLPCSLYESFTVQLHKNVNRSEMLMALVGRRFFVCCHLNLYIFCIPMIV